MSPLWLGPPFRRYGEALNPGPKLFTTVQTINVSSLWDTIDLLGKEEPAYTMIQEHCTPPLKTNAACADLGQLGRSALPL